MISIIKHTWLTLIVLSATAQSFAQDEANRSVTNSLGQKLRFIPAGSFIMGGRQTGPGGFRKDHPQYDGADERPLHPVRLTKPFYLAENEVTVAQFREFVESTKYVTTNEANGIVGFDPHEPEGDRRAKFAFREKKEFNWKNPGFTQQDNHPVVGISWKDAQAFCRWLSEKENVKYRLPTEAEWEYACRAGAQSYFAWGDSYAEIHKFANIGNVEFEKAYPDRAYIQWALDVEKDEPDPHVFTAPVGSYPANQWGIRDMHGNVWEWVEDVYIDTAYTKYKRPRYDRPIQRAIDPFNTETFNDDGDWRSIRGGCWATSPLHCRSGIRSYYESNDAAAYLGFRVVRDANTDEIATAKATFDAEEAARQLVKNAVGNSESSSGTDLRVRLDSQASAEVMHALREIGGLSEVHYNGNGKGDASLIADIAAVPGLRVFHLHNAGREITGADFAPLAARTDLEQLHISACPNVDDQLCTHITGLTNLRSLRLFNEKITDAGLGQLRRLVKLRVLNIQSTQSNGEILTELTQAPLERIEVRRISEQAASQLKNFPKLTELYIYDSSMSDQGIVSIAGLRRLKSLRLRDCPNISQSAFQQIAELRSLTSLELTGVTIGDDTIERLTNMQLRTLELNSENITDASMRHICSLITLSRLTLGNKTKVTDRGLKYSWRMNQLHHLELFSTQITGKGFEPLTELPELYVLMLGSPNLTDQAFAFLSEAPAMNHLEVGTHINENSKNLTDEGLRYLAENNRWRHISFNRKGTGITDDGIERLRNTLKATRIDIRD